MIQALVAALKDTFASVQNMPKLNRPIPLVLSGGTVMAPVFGTASEDAAGYPAAGGDLGSPARSEPDECDCTRRAGGGAERTVRASGAGFALR